MGTRIEPMQRISTDFLLSKEKSAKIRRIGSIRVPILFIFTHNEQNSTTGTN